MSRVTLSSAADIRIGGDTLALDPPVRAHILTEARALQARYPLTSLRLQIRVSGELDPLHGHRVRCELAAEGDGRRKIMVRDARKNALDAISGAFATAKRQLRGSGARSIGRAPLRPPLPHTAGT